MCRRFDSASAHQNLTPVSLVACGGYFIIANGLASRNALILDALQGVFNDSLAMPRARRTEPRLWKHKNGIRYIVWQEDGKTRMRSTGTKRAAAAEAELRSFREDWERRKWGRQEEAPIGRAVDEWIAEKEKPRWGLAQSTLNQYRSVANRLKAFLPERLLASEVSPRDLRRYLDHLEADFGLTPQGLRKRIGILSMMFEWLVKEGLVGRNPAKALDAPKGEPKPIGELPESRYRDLLQSLEAEREAALTERRLRNSQMLRDLLHELDHLRPGLAFDHEVDHTGQSNPLLQEELEILLDLENLLDHPMLEVDLDQALSLVVVLLESQLAEIHRSFGAGHLESDHFPVGGHGVVQASVLALHAALSLRPEGVVDSLALQESHRDLLRLRPLDVTPGEQLRAPKPGRDLGEAQEAAHASLLALRRSIRSLAWWTVISSRERTPISLASSSGPRLRTRLARLAA